MNNVTLIGNVGNEPELKKLSTTELCSFSLATSDGWGENKKTNWHNCKAFGKTAELINKYVKKGAKVGIIGSISYDNWEDKEGNKRYATSILVNHVEFLSNSSNQPKEEKGESHDEKYSNGNEFIF